MKAKVKRKTTKKPMKIKHDNLYSFPQEKKTIKAENLKQAINELKGGE